MKYKLLFPLMMTIVALCGCGSQRDVVVNAQAEFVASDIWVLVSIKGKEVTFAEGQKRVSIHVNPEAGTFGGNNGCNRYFGNFKDLGEGRMELSDINATKMACPEAFHKIERNYMQLLRRCDGYSLGEYTLDLKQGETVLLTFEKVVK